MTEPRCLRCKEPEHMHGATDVAREHLGNDCAGFVALPENADLWRSVVLDILNSPYYRDEEGFIRFHPESIIGNSLRRLSEALAAPEAWPL